MCPLLEPWRHVRKLRKRIGELPQVLVRLQGLDRVNHGLPILQPRMWRGERIVSPRVPPILDKRLERRRHKLCFGIHAADSCRLGPSKYVASAVKSWRLAFETGLHALWQATPGVIMPLCISGCTKGPLEQSWCGCLVREADTSSAARPSISH